jgi:hypothetical protein
VRTRGPSFPRRLPGPERDVRTTKTAPRSSTKRALHGVRVTDHTGTYAAPTTPQQAQYYVRHCKSLGNERTAARIGNCIHGAGGTTRAAMPRRRSLLEGRIREQTGRLHHPRRPDRKQQVCPRGHDLRPRRRPHGSRTGRGTVAHAPAGGGYLDTYWVPLLADGGYLPNATSASGRRLDLVPGSWQASGR